MFIRMKEMLPRRLLKIGQSEPTRYIIYLIFNIILFTYKTKTSIMANKSSPHGGDVYSGVGHEVNALYSGKAAETEMDVAVGASEMPLRLRL